MTIAIKAILLLCIGKLIFAIQDVIIKQLSNQYPLAEIMLVRSAVALPILLIIIWQSQGIDSLKANRIGQQLFRGGLMFSAFFLFYLGLAELSLTLNTVLFFTAPFFISILSILCLGEQVGKRRWVGICIGFAGVLVILRPAAGVFNSIMLLPIIAAVLYAWAQIMSRQLGTTSSSAIITFYANISFLVLSILVALTLSVFSPNLADSPSADFLVQPWQGISSPGFWLVMITGITGSLGFLMTTQAYRINEASHLACYEYVMLVWVVALSYLVWKELPDFQTIVGTALIVGAGIYVMLREHSATVAG